MHSKNHNSGSSGSDQGGRESSAEIPISANATVSDKAFVLAAGFGTRLRPHTLERPKPMVEVAGKSLIKRTFDHLSQAGIKEVVVNGHYLSGVLEKHCSEVLSIKVQYVHEPEVLDTGGGIKNALSAFQGRDFFVLSGDGLWDNISSEKKILNDMRNAWDPEKMDVLVLLQPVSSMVHTQGIGDYDFVTSQADRAELSGPITRSLNQSGSYMFTSIRINSSSVFDGASDTPFSYLQILDKAEKKGRLYGMVHKANWHHISTPADLESVRKLYTKKS